MGQKKSNVMEEPRSFYGSNNAGCTRAPNTDMSMSFCGEYIVFAFLWTPSAKLLFDRHSRLLQKQRDSSKLSTVCDVG